MDFETLNDHWRQHAQAELPAALEANAVMTIITAKTGDIRRSVRRRLRREATYDVPMLAVTVTLFLEGITPIRLAFAGGLLILLGGIAATLWLAQRRIAETPLDRSVREALMRSPIEDRCGGAGLCWSLRGDIRVLGSRAREPGVVAPGNGPCPRRHGGGWLPGQPVVVPQRARVCRTNVSRRPCESVGLSGTTERTGTLRPAQV